MEDEKFPKRESMKKAYRAEWDDRHRKNFPINTQRFLRANLGRPWNDVYSDFCKKLPRPDDRFAADCFIYVEFDTYEEDGKIYDSRDYKVYYGFYVFDGILCEAKEKTKYHSYTPEERRKASGIRWIDNKVLALINGIWYELITEERKDIRDYDEYMKSSYSDNYHRKLYYGNENYFCSGKRQLNKGEIKKYNLRGEI